MQSSTDVHQDKISSHTLWWVGFSLLILFTFILYFVRLSSPDLWTDEVLSQLKFDHLAENLRHIARDVHPPMYFIMTWWWNMVWHPSAEAGLRSFSALVGVCCVILVVVLGSRLAHRNFGLLAGLVVALSPFFLQYSRMHRYYALMAFWLLLALVFLFSRGEKGYWWGIRCGLANLGLIYTNYLGGILILGQAGMIPFVFPREKRIWWKWLIGQGIMVLGFLPWLWVMAKQAARGNIAYEVVKAHAPLFALMVTKTKSIILKVVYTGYVFFIGETTFPWKLVITVPVVIVVFVGIMMILMRRKTPVPCFRVLLGFAVGSLLVVVVLSELYGRIFSFQSFALLPSRLLPLVPVFLIVMVFGLYSIKHQLLKALLIVALLMGEAYGTWHYYAQDQYLNPKYAVSWRSVVQFIKDRSTYTGFSCTDESSFLYYNKLLGGPPAYGVMDLPQGFREVGGVEDTLSLWVISRYRGDPGIRLAYDELIAFCQETFPVGVDTGFSQVDPTLSRFLTRVTGDAAPDRIVSVIQYIVPFGAMGIDGMEAAMRKFINASPMRKQTLGWISDDPASDIMLPKSKDIK